MREARAAAAPPGGSRRNRKPMSSKGRSERAAGARPALPCAAPFSRMLASVAAALVLAFLPLSQSVAQAQAQQWPNGWILLSGGGEKEELAPPDALELFRALAGGPDSSVLFVPTAASSLRLPSGEILDVPAQGPLGPDAVAFEKALALHLGVRRVEILHTRDRREADSDAFVRRISKARAVWLSSGNAGRLIDAYLNTKTERALRELLGRGGVVAGTSAGAIILGSYVIRGRADKPVLMARGREKGFGFLANTAINPHFLAAHRETELITIVDWHPQLIGLGIDTGAAALVHRGSLQPLGSGRVGVYDNVRRPKGWYYMLDRDSCLDLASRKAASGRCPFEAEAGKP